MAKRVFRKLDVGKHKLLQFTFDEESARVEKGKLIFPLSFEMAAPKIPQKDLLEVIAFFRKVWRQYKAEAIVFLYFAPTLDKWRFVAVPQTVSPAHLDWETPGASPAGWVLAGSFHSHGANMGAFHSPTDKNDELQWEGIHVTIGKVMDSVASYSATIVIGDERFEVSIEDLVEPAEDAEFPEAWMAQVKKFEPPKVMINYPFGLVPSRWGANGGGDDEA